MKFELGPELARCSALTSATHQYERALRALRDLPGEAAKELCATGDSLNAEDQ